MTQINVSSFPKIGNMVKGSGLNGVFDATNATTGYAESTVGYVGLNCSSSPQVIGYVEVVSATNGFDASGLTTGITLSLRGKNGAAPTGAFDGTVMGSLTFTDANYQHKKTIYSNDATTAWDYVWVSVHTGVWAVASEVSFFGPDDVSAPEPSPTTVTIYQKSCDAAIPLNQSPGEISGFTFDIAVDEPSVAAIDFVVNVAHVGNLFSPQYLNALGIGVELLFKHSTDFLALDAVPWQLPPISRTNGTNIDDRNPEHYENVGLPTSLALSPGYYRFSLRMSAHTDGDYRNGLAVVWAEAGKGLNGLRVIVFKGASYRNMNEI